MTRGQKGFTLVEVLVAIMVLSVGITALVGSSALVSRMVGRGRMGTRAAQMASRRMEDLRVKANSTSPRCTAGTFVGGGPVTSQGVTEKWVITGTTLRTIIDSVQYRAGRLTHTDVLTTQVRC
jgi:prepilin-type N-terminal cleavage/methylation domain-containing protein